MENWQIILLGIIQGITEFLPVSSSGHLILTPKLFEFEDQGLALDAILHLATLLAIIIFFKNDLSKLLKSLFNKKDSTGYRGVAWSIVLASFPAAIAGLLFGEWIESHIRTSSFVAGNLILWSFVFLVADRREAHSNKAVKRIGNIRMNQILLIGVAQALALLPGTSRSGITIAAGLFGGLAKETAARFSFLLGAPIILAAGLYKFFDLLTQPEPISYSATQLLLSFTVAFIFGLASIKILLKIVSKFGLLPFIIYRITLATLIFFLFP